jgi:ankyrin repeat protein
MTDALGKRLLDAVRADDLEGVHAALDGGASPNAFTLYDEGDPNSKLSALYFACNDGRTAIARLLLERGAAPDDGESVYHAAEHGHVECLEALLEHGASLSSPHAHWNNAPLHFLAGYLPDFPNVARTMTGTRWLLEHGADPNVRTPRGGETPMHFVAERGRHFELARLLLAHGADPDVAREDGRTPWVLALRGGHVEMAALLAAAGAVPEASVLDRFFGACARGEEAQARAMLAAQPDLVTTMPEVERELLPRLATWGNSAGVRVMVAMGFDLAWEDRFGGSALHQAAWRGNAAMVRELLALGAPLELRDKNYGSTPLGWASHGSTHADRSVADYPGVVSALIDAGASREGAFNRWGVPPEEFANAEVAALLRARGLAPPVA